MLKVLSSVLLLIITINLSSQSVFKVDYYNGTNFEKYVGSGTADKLDFYWDHSPPIDGLMANFCSVKYTGTLTVPEDVTVTCEAYYDDGVRVYVNGNVIISDWALNDVGHSTGTIQLQEGKTYPIIVEFFNAEKEAELTIEWKVPVESDRNWLSEWWYGEDMVHFPVTYGAPLEDNIVQFEVVVEELNEIIESKDKEEVLKPIVLKPVDEVVSKPSPEPVKIVESPIIEVPKNVTDEMLGEYIPKSVEFEQAKSEILTISYPELDRLAALLVSNPDRNLTIEGHTDYVGDAAKNLELSERRARAVAAYLIKKGVSHTQIVSAKGYGGSRPIIKSNDKKYHPENRRVDFILE